LTLLPLPTPQTRSIAKLKNSLSFKKNKVDTGGLPTCLLGYPEKKVSAHR
jgi:hypothetical protein